MITHNESRCKGSYCAIHNPSDHKMKLWPKVVRETGLIERTCEHGVGHPDPDSVAYYLTIGKDFSIHGCDGCCGEWNESNDKT